MSSYWVRARRVCAALGSVVLLATANTALADTVTLNPNATNYAGDGGLNANPVLDGQFDHVHATTGHLYASKTVNWGVEGEYRSGVSFQLPTAVTQPGITILSAKLRLNVTSETVPVADVISVHGLLGVPPFVADDFEINNPIASLSLAPSSQWPAQREFDVTSWVQSQAQSGGSVKLTLRIGAWGTYLVWTHNATLVVDYSLTTVGAAPSLDLLEPVAGTTVPNGSPVTFLAMSSDAEDGTLDPAIQWSSSLNGPIGAGAMFTTSSLSPGAHVITAAVTDSDGNTTTKTTSVTVLAPPNIPPTISLISPATGSAYLQGTAITFQANASDAEDGNRNNFIQWSSSINGAIGNNEIISVSWLSVGTHVITASVKDSAGVSASASITVVVQAPANTAPTVSISSPLNGSSLGAGANFTLSGSASDVQQGNMSSSIQWILDGSSTLGTGSSLITSIATAGAHTITARVTDSGGLVGEQMVSVTVSAAPPPSAYCSLRGETAQWEWIANVSSGGVNNSSGGSTTGYRDFTNVTYNFGVGAGNQISLTPGIAGGASYVERWYVFIDLNRDMQFSANEQLVSTMIAGTLNTSFTIPAGTQPGTTRMRVIISYGTTPPPCGTFRYGEVEDYTVNIQGGSNPPPPPPSASYCTSRGTNSSYEFVQQIVANGATRTSGNNAGYADLTGSPITLLRGGNVLALTPGFSSGSYTETWRVWIDFNKDGVFGSEDSVFTGSGSSTVNGNATVPTSAAAGLTRMRVQMKYGSSPTACETFDYGEVEDFAVQIP